jgi:hypothetical protein
MSTLNRVVCMLVLGFTFCWAGSTGPVNLVGSVVEDSIITLLLGEISERSGNSSSAWLEIYMNKESSAMIVRICVKAERFELRDYVMLKGGACFYKKKSSMKNIESFSPAVEGITKITIDNVSYVCRRSFSIEKTISWNGDGSK